MPKEDPTSPIVPSGPCLRSDDVELAHFAKPPPCRNQRRSSSKCFVYALAPIIILRATFLGFALTVHVKSPELRLRRVDVKSLDSSTAASFSAPSTASPVGEAVLRNTNFSSNLASEPPVCGGLARRATLADVEGSSKRPASPPRAASAILGTPERTMEQQRARREKRASIGVGAARQRREGNGRLMHGGAATSAERGRKVQIQNFERKQMERDRGRRGTNGRFLSQTKEREKFFPTINALTGERACRLRGERASTG